MKVKVTIFVLSAVLLWSNLLTSSHYNHFSKQREVKASTELVTKAIVSDEDPAWKKNSYHPYIFFKSVLPGKHSAQGKLVNVGSYFAKTCVKYFLLFRVLRN
ncbi:MAG TPA: hypothetical protein VFZ52_13090 [Chryseolinea sp.]